MKSMLAVLLTIAALSSGCAQMPPAEIPVAVPCPPPPPAPAALKGKSVSTGPSISERLESLIEKRDDSLTKARR